MRGPAAARMQGLWVRIPPRASMSVSRVVCCQVEVSASGWSPVQSSPIECGVSECDREASIRRPRPTGLLRHGGKRIFLQNHHLLHHATGHNATDRLNSSTCSPCTPQTFICLVPVIEYVSIPTTNIFLFYITLNSANDLLRIAKQIKISKVTD